MKVQLHNKALASFAQWFDHVLLDDGQAFVNHSGNLYSQNDSRLNSSIYKYASPHKQWVADSSVSNANIPTGVNVNGVYTPFIDGSLFPDWNNGRILSTSELTGNLTANYATKEFNTYITNQREEEIIFQSRYEVNPYYGLNVASGIQPYVHAWPACYITYREMLNEPWSMGSSDFQKEQLNFRVIAITNNTMHLDGLFSLFMQKKDKCFKLLEFTDDPFNRYGGFKNSFSGVYNYNDVANARNDMVYVSKVSTSKFFSASHEMMQQAMQVGFINFNLEYFRSPD